MARGDLPQAFQDVPEHSASTSAADAGTGPATSDICRVCAQGAGGDKGPLVAPCCCAGANRYVHIGCLQQQRLQDGLLSDSFWECSVCGAAYRMKSRVGWLRPLTWEPTVRILSAASAYLVVVMASELCSISVYYLGPMLEDSPEEGKAATPFVLEFPILGFDAGYWVGGLLVITLLKKIIQSIILGSFVSTLLQYVTFVPTLIKMSRVNDGISRFMVWWMLVIYALHASSWVLVAGCGLVHVFLSMLAREEALDFVSLPATADRRDQTTDSDGASTVCDSEVEQCLCCWDQPAVFAIKKCGHVVACSTCQKRLVYRQLTLDSQKGVGHPKPVPRMRLLSQSHLQNTAVSCPLCRQCDVLVRLPGKEGVEPANVQAGKTE